MSDLKINGVSIKKIPVELTTRGVKKRISGKISPEIKQLYHETVKTFSFEDIIKVGCQVLNFSNNNELKD